MLKCSRYLNAENVKCSKYLDAGNALKIKLIVKEAVNA